MKEPPIKSFPRLFVLWIICEAPQNEFQKEKASNVNSNTFEILLDNKNKSGEINWKLTAAGTELKMSNFW